MVDVTRVRGEIAIRNHHVARFVEYDDRGQVWEYVRPIWAQDPSDYSWIATDDDGDTYRASRVYGPDGETFWIISWSIGPVRVGTFLHPGETQAKLAAESLMEFK